MEELNIDIEQINKRIIQEYEIEGYIGYQKINIGIEDFTYYLKTTKKKYIVKILNFKKTLRRINEILNRYINMQENKIAVPSLIKNRNNQHILAIEVQKVYLNIILMECIEGSDLYSLDKLLTRKDIDFILQGILKIHQIDNDLACYDDLYFFYHLEKAIQKAGSILTNKEKTLADQLVKQLKTVEWDKLPKTYIHGDLTKGNIMKDKKEKIWFIDLSVSGKGYRILDMINILNNAIFDYRDIPNSKLLQEYFLEQNQIKEPLTNYELQNLDLFRKCDCLINFMLKRYDQSLGKNKTKQCDFWIKNSEEQWKVLMEEGE